MAVEVADSGKHPLKPVDPVAEGNKGPVGGSLDTEGPKPRVSIPIVGREVMRQSYIGPGGSLRNKTPDVSVGFVNPVPKNTPFIRSTVLEKGWEGPSTVSTKPDAPTSSPSQDARPAFPTRWERRDVDPKKTGTLVLRGRSDPKALWAENLDTIRAMARRELQMPTDDPGLVRVVEAYRVSPGRAQRELRKYYDEKVAS